MLWVISVLSLFFWVVAAWEWRLPQGLETRIIGFQTKLSASVCTFYSNWSAEESPEEAVHRMEKELVQAELALGVPLFLVVKSAHGFEQAYIKPCALVERRFPGSVI